LYIGNKTITTLLTV